MHLDDIDRRNVIQRDASLSRPDLAGSGHQQITAAAASNPKFSLSEPQEAVAINALSNIMLAFGDGTVNIITNKMWVRVRFGKQEHSSLAYNKQKRKHLIRSSLTEC
ncbi:uncharacterized protein PgNI_01988 [Pyricularia grisea]|uniref:Uncharacterized protein n=1 Tax=Pyricularia grisea TaxID=148305 RepID=A0A6P8BFK8_PYRGI|nr:uncharacterized protein PgNI_01988 [Pyricularia grisea]TLD15621.1 hypothetical protein PgNI_01988 [Pyricularia grisea]